MPDSIFVFGAGGFIGTHLVRELTRGGASIIAASRKSFHSPGGVKTYVGELRDSEDFASLIVNCHTVVHLASTSTPGSSAGNPFAELHANLHVTLALLHALQERPDMHLVYISSAGNLYPPLSTAASESIPTTARSYHGAGKAAAEHFIAAWCIQYGARATILRPSNIYGPGQHERAGFAIVPTAMGRALRGETLTIWGDGSAVRDYLYIDDFVALCTAAIRDCPSAGCEVFNAASGTSTRLDSLLKMIESVSGRSLRLEHAVPRAVDAVRVAIDNRAAMRRYGWAPRVELQHGLERTWAWLTSRSH